MKIIEIDNLEKRSVINQLNENLKGTITINNGEEILEFKNELGQGKIRTISFDWGITLLDYDVYFYKDLKIIYKITEYTPIEFLFVSEGTLKYNNSDNNYVQLERFQNIILSNKINSQNIYLFPSQVNVKLNVIQVLSKEYRKKKNNNIDALQNVLLSLFKGESKNLPYKHMGGYNLSIASEIKDLNTVKGSGIIKSLSIEGQLNLIMALQIAEHKNFVCKEFIPDTLTKNDIKKIHEAAKYIVDHVSYYMSIKTLTTLFGITPKKLQLGFKLLYSKSVNEYIRQIKLEIGRDLIKNTDKTISEIVYCIGYKSRSYFSKVFYDKYGILPIEYRDSLKKVQKISK